MRQTALSPDAGGNFHLPSLPSAPTSSFSAGTFPPPKPMMISIPYPRNDKYYFMDGNVTFVVENTLFKVHRYFFERDSVFFRELLYSYRSGEELPDTRIYLDKVRAIDFERFTSVFYPTEYGSFDATTTEEWASILALAAKWGFKSVRTLALKELGQIAAPVDKIVLGRKYGVKEWLFGAYRDICMRSEPLTPEEGEKLGLAEVLKISEAKQSVAKESQGWGVSPWTVDNAIRKIFSLNDLAAGGGSPQWASWGQPPAPGYNAIPPPVPYPPPAPYAPNFCSAPVQPPIVIHQPPSPPSPIIIPQPRAVSPVSSHYRSPRIHSPVSPRYSPPRIHSPASTRR